MTPEALRAMAKELQRRAWRKWNVPVEKRHHPHPSPKALRIAARTLKEVANDIEAGEVQ